MSKRPAITPKMKVDALLWRYVITCRICNTRVRVGEPIEWDHITPYAAGGDHNHANLQPVHRLCHRAKTIGTGATTAGSDIGKIAKVKRIVRTCKFTVQRGVEKTEHQKRISAAMRAWWKRRRQWAKERAKHA